MTVTIKNVSNGEGWFPYVLIKNGEVRREAMLLDGDPVLGNAICNSLNYKSGNSVNFVISFAKEDSVTQERGRIIAREFMQSFMDGFREDEYHLDLVEHNDTNHLHYHARIPKVNLLTNTQLKLYWHKSDLEYKKAVIADICHKHGLVTGTEMKNAIPNPLHKFNQINTWREQHAQEPLDLASPKLKRATEKKLSEYIAQAVKAGLINSLDDVKAELMSLELDVVNEGYDRTNEFHYLTIENESGKIRIKGDIYSAEFYQLAREDRAKSVNDNRAFGKGTRELEISGTDIKQALQRERIKRLKFIEKQYGNARKRAYQREDEASIKADRNQEQRDIGRLGTQNEEYPRNNVRNTSADSERGQGSSKNTKDDVRQEQRADTRHDAEVGGSEQRENRLHMALDNDVRSMDGWHRMGIDLSQSKPTDTKEREQREEDNQRTSKRVAKAEVRDREVQKWTIYTHTKRRELDDSIRAEIESTIRETAGSFYTRIKEDIYDVRRGYLRSQKRDREAVADIEALRECIHELANQHRQETSTRVGGESEREDTALDRAAREASRQQSALSKSYAGLERELDREVGRVGEKAGEYEQGRRGLGGAVKYCIKKVVEKAREIAQKIQKSYNGPTMMR